MHRTVCGLRRADLADWRRCERSSPDSSMTSTRSASTRSSEALRPALCGSRTGIGGATARRPTRDQRAGLPARCRPVQASRPPWSAAAGDRGPALGGRHDAPALLRARRRRTRSNRHCSSGRFATTTSTAATRSGSCSPSSNDTSRANASRRIRSISPQRPSSSRQSGPEPAIARSGGGPSAQWRKPVLHRGARRRGRPGLAGLPADTARHDPRPHSDARRHHTTGARRDRSRRVRRHPVCWPTSAGLTSTPCATCSTGCSSGRCSSSTARRCGSVMSWLARCSTTSCCPVSAPGSTPSLPRASSVGVRIVLGRSPVTGRPHTIRHAPSRHRSSPADKP